MALRIIRLINTDPGFYPTMGPFLANRDVVKFVGDKIWDDPGKTWFVAQEDGAVVGFVSVHEMAKRTLVESLYLVDADRRNVAEILVATAVHAFGNDRHLQATVHRDAAYAYTAAEFAEIAPKGKNFLKLARPATITTDGKK